ncbi:MAG TPA: hypothetical protein VJM31_02745 [Vicinamibacterales bacterium]|nr:hypothetical protein [Vicinamibacterales bacterium]
MRHLHAFVLVAGLLSAGVVLEARQTAPQRRPTPSTAPPQIGSQQSSAGMLLPEARDARETRERLEDLLEQYPPSLREVLRIDPTLLHNDNYLSTYPVLAAFLQQHPEVAHNPGFFLGEREFSEQNNTPQMEAARALREVVDGFTIFAVVGMLTMGVVFLVKTVVEHRRWQRASKAQAELNNKLIDRFAASDELLAYLQSAQGKALTDTTVLPQATSRSMDAPLGRIFWSLQAGSVLGFAGAGLLFVSSRIRDDWWMVAPTIFAFGTVVLMVGLGFLVSSLISFLLSQRLGLVRSLSTRYSGGEAPGA